MVRKRGYVFSGFVCKLCLARNKHRREWIPAIYLLINQAESIEKAGCIWTTELSISDPPRCFVNFIDSRVELLIFITLLANVNAKFSLHSFHVHNNNT